MLVVDRVDVQIVTYAPTVFYHCQHCELTFSEVGLGDSIHREQAREALPEDLRIQFEDLTLALHQLVTRFGERVHVRLIDAASIEGFFKSLRWRVRKYPAVIIDGIKQPASAGLSDLKGLVEHRLEERAGSLGS
jgi:hypothetical protein